MKSRRNGKAQVSKEWDLIRGIHLYLEVSNYIGAVFISVFPASKLNLCRQHTLTPASLVSPATYSYSSMLINRLRPYSGPEMLYVSFIGLKHVLAVQY